MTEERKQTNVESLLLHVKTMHPGEFTILVVDKDTEQKATEAYKEGMRQTAEEREKRRQDRLRGLERASSIVIG